jgi:WXXGXW repeat (2 copies)
MIITRTTRYLLIAAVLLVFSAVSPAQVFLSVNFGPPALPVYAQPVGPGEGYMWTPGYWAWGPYGYYWVPGTWVLAPQPGVLWTPGYWAFGGALYYWHPGYWGPVVGFYGGIPYGYGYTGTGYYGGYWRENRFYYNQAVSNVNVTNVRNVYNTTVINNTNVTRVSYNGGPGGIVAHATPEQEAAERQTHLAPTPLQIQHENLAKDNSQLRASVNQGRPSIAATAKPGDFSAHGSVAATRAGAPYRAPENHATSENNVAHPENNERPEAEGSKAITPRNYVPRPPSAADRDNTPRAETAPSANGTPRVESSPRSVPRPPSSYQASSPSHGTAMPGAETSRPENTSRAGNVPRPESSQPRPASPRTEDAPRPAPGPRPQSTPPQHETAPRPQAAPRPESVAPESRPPEGRHENPSQR